VTARREPERAREASEERAALARYLMALAVSVSALSVSGVVAGATGQGPLYAPLIGAVAVAVWYGGGGPALATMALCWLGALWLEEPRGEAALRDSGEMLRWGTSLAIAFVTVAVAEALRLGSRRARDIAATAKADLVGLEALNVVAAALATSVSSADVSRALTEEGARLVGADGAVVGLLEGDEVLLTHPTGLAWQTSLPEERLPLGRMTLLARAIHENATVHVASRAELARSYPDTAAMMPTARGAIAIPLRASGAAIGALGFVFEREGAPGEEEIAYADTTARLAEQALERARLYERERGTRQALDRILLLAPRFRAESAAGAARSVCQEARTSFGADFSLLWRVHGQELELVALDPPRPELEGQLWPLASFPDLESAIASLGVSFVPDVLEETRGSGLELNRALGIRSSLRTPIVLSGQVQLVLSLSWQLVVSEPDRTTVAIVRRFADQAALALEESERRRAERVAARRADDMHRLQSLTAALSNALTRADVANVAVEHVRAASGADGAAVGAVVEERQVLRLLAWAGYDDDAVVGWAETPPDDSTLLGRALERGEPAFYESRSVLRAGYPALGPEDAPDGYESLLLVPLVAGRRTNGMLALSWAAQRELTEDELGYVRSMASQVAQALDRATHFESEQTIAETLQRSVLPATLPRLDGVQLAARYLPGSAVLDVGGDWFDAFGLPDGRIGLVVGDVVGKGVLAAASMGQLRNALRAFSVDRLKPASVLARLNRLAEEVLDTTFATVVYVVLDPDSGVCRMSSAGHPPPVARYPDGRVELLEGGRGLPLGTGLDVRYRQEALDLPAGTSLLLYSDGLVERRGASIDDGLRDLCEAVRTAPTAPEPLLEHVLKRMVGDQERGDDIALLTARVLVVAPRDLDLVITSDPAGLELVRDAIRVWLAGTELDRSDAEDVVLAAWEACANACEHARDPTKDIIRVRATLRRQTVQIVVEDSGQWKPPSASSERGLGLRLMRSVMSSVDVAVGNAGTRVTIEKSPAGARPA
jgi:serine phosphatase RsbU (regulator of sigma subunit)/anti-sigma regulatory factor (Ser/Thr protein kinase)